MLPLLFLTLSVSVLVSVSVAAPVTISNASPRRDTAGDIMDAHDSKFVHVDGVYYWFAASYGKCKEPAGNSGCAGAKMGACGYICRFFYDC